MHDHHGRRRLRAAAAAAALTAAAFVWGCAAPPPGAPGRGGAPAADPALLTAGGARVRIDPPEGFCLDPASAVSGPQGAFVMMQGCGDDDERPAQVLLVSLGAGPIFAAPEQDRAARAAALDALEAFVQTPEGRVSAGMGGPADRVEILAMRRAGDSLFVLVRDEENPFARAMGERFWRAFTQLGGRAAVVSSGVFGAGPLDDDRLLIRLARAVVALKRANGDPISADERELAEAEAAPAMRPAPDSIADSIAVPASRPARRTVAGRGGPPAAPMPRARPAV
ncbi:hypothetical protein [Oceanicella actignis]|uniref:Uncharacterized protein n=1 Tax=Oceanicella actignis TaxID=1189325 RepID=A0A1M7TVI9_9RHOB|nr:hypothetical protein [Oceanicella actignis]SES80510.1 hypothetical protein SAMN04488119_101522 [Oceanicella actignis]SHN74759.1 hypothetical protein SAMN05216200_110102 [Oceanicella actignis]